MTLMLILGVMTATAVALLAVPMLRHARREPDGRRAAENLSVYRDRLHELEAEETAGVLSGTQAEAARDELAAGLLHDVDGDRGAPRSGAGPGRRTVLASALIVALAIPLVAGGVYWQSDTWRVAVGQPLPREPDAIMDLVERLQAVVKDQPRTVPGWVMLGRAYTALNQYAAAATAYDYANRLSGGRSAVLLAQQGEALGLAHGNDLRGRPRALFEQALAIDPRHPKALWYAGVGAFQAGDFAQAAEYWRLLAAQDSLPGDLATALQDRIAEARFRAGTDAPVSEPAAAAVSISVRVTLSPALAGEVPSGATVYLFASAANGPPMPLAVVRRPVSALPLSVTLDDSQAMLAGRTLSAFDRWEITARISLSGSVEARPGDLYARTTLERSALPKTVHLEIDRQVGEQTATTR